MSANEQPVRVSVWEEDLVRALTESTELRALIGTKIYPTQAPDNEKPDYVVWQEVSAISETTHQGPQDLDFPLVQFTTWSKDLLKALKIRKVIRAAIEGKNLPGDHNVSSSFSNMLTNYDPSAKLHGAILELRFHVKP